MTTPAILIVGTMLNTIAREYPLIAKQCCIQLGRGKHADMPYALLTLTLRVVLTNVALAFVASRATLAQQLCGTLLNVALNLGVIVDTRSHWRRML